MSCIFDMLCNLCFPPKNAIYIRILSFVSTVFTFYVKRVLKFTCPTLSTKVLTEYISDCYACGACSVISFATTDFSQQQITSKTNEILKI